MHYFSQSFNYECVLSSLPCLQYTLILLLSHSWAHVIIGMWHKYPNPHCSHVVTVDVVDRSVDSSTGIIRTERVLGCKQRTPTWIVKVGLSPLHPRNLPYGRGSYAALWWVRGCVRS
jgi:hypothetical protein